MKIKVGGLNFELADLKEVSENYGQVDYDKLEIKISPHVVKQQKETTLSHEILHILFNVSGLGSVVEVKDDGVEEKYVRILENVFYSFLKNNTDFFKGVGYV